MPTLNIMSLKFCAGPIPSHLKGDFEPFVVVLLREGLDEWRVVEERSWYHNKAVAALLFKEQDSH